MTVPPTHYEWTDEEEGIRYEIMPAETRDTCPDGSACFEVRNPVTATNIHVCDQEWGNAGPTEQDFRRILGKAREKGF